MINRPNWLDYLAMIILIIGGLNWGLIGLFGFDIVPAIFGLDGAVNDIVYIIVGLSALYILFRWAFSGGRREDHPPTTS